ncbi:MAG: hypothetical protein ACE5GS_03075 [Kiloniellaceae bacterium]
MQPTWNDRESRPDDRDGLGELAEALVETLGFEGAVRACRANVWDGVLASVMARQAMAAGGDP